MIHPLLLRVVVLLFVLVLSSSNQVLANDVVHDGVPRTLAVIEIVTTAACNEIRFDKYRARLDLFYFYTVIFASDNGMRVDVTGIENAIAHAVSSALSGCDDQERPLYAVKLSATGHALSNGPGLCETISLDAATQCHMVRGVTSILLDSDASNAESTAYATIERVLLDTFFLNQFTVSDLKSAEFVRPIGENLVVMTTTSDDETEQSSSSDGKALIAIATASVSFLLTGVFLFGLYRARQRNLARDSALSPIKARVAHYQAKRRRYFSQLEQAHAHANDGEQLEPGWMVTDEAGLQHQHHQQHHHHVSVAPSITWSVSDLTSDSASIRSSNMSHSTRLERIEEVEEAPSDEYEYDEERASFTHDDDLECPSSSLPIHDDDLESPSSAPPILNVHNEHLNFIAHWNNLVTAIVSVQQNAVTKGNETCHKDLDVETKDKEEVTTPVRKNRIEDYDATGEDDSGLHGFRFLDESVEEDVHADHNGKQDVAVDVFDISPSSQHKTSFVPIIRHSSVPSDGAPTDQQQADYQYDPELQHWYENTLLQLDRALHQKRLKS